MESTEVLEILNARREGAGSTVADERTLISRARRRRDSDCSEYCADCFSDVGDTSGVLPDGRKVCTECFSRHLDRHLWLKPEPTEPGFYAGQRTPSKRESSRTRKRKSERAAAAMIASSLVAFLVISYPMWRQRRSSLMA